jgi:hypothetical protein
VSQPPTLMFCAGAVKAGTSWLYEYLRSHPEAHFRTIKELQFFNKMDAGAMASRIKRLEREVEGLEAELDSGKTRFPGWVLQQIADRDDNRKVLKSADPVAAYMGYLTAGSEGKRLVGDLTPEYGLLTVEEMRVLAGLAPDVRWVFVMRDPVSRMWSHIRMLVRRAKVDEAGLAAACAAKFDEVLAGQAPDVTQRSDYAGIHSRLVQAVAADKRLVLSYEGMMSPGGVQRVTRFLGLSAHPAPLDKRVHQGVAVAMPDDLRQRARDWLRPQYEYVAATMGLPQEWERFPELKSEVA